MWQHHVPSFQSIFGCLWWRVCQLHQTQEDGAWRGSNWLQPEELLTLALNKYAILHKQNLRNTKSPEGERVLTLTSKEQKILWCQSETVQISWRKAKQERKVRKAPMKTQKTNGLGRRKLQKLASYGQRRSVRIHITGASGTSWIIHDPNATSGPTACKLYASRKRLKQTLYRIGLIQAIQVPQANLIIYKQLMH